MLDQVQPPYSSESQRFAHPILRFPMCQHWPLNVEFAHLGHKLNSLTLLKAMWPALLQGFVANCSQVSVVPKVLHLARSKSQGWKPQSLRVRSVRPVWLY